MTTTAKVNSPVNVALKYRGLPGLDLGVGYERSTTVMGRITIYTNFLTLRWRGQERRSGSAGSDVARTHAAGGVTGGCRSLLAPYALPPAPPVAISLRRRMRRRIAFAASRVSQLPAAASKEVFQRRTPGILSSSLWEGLEATGICTDCG